MRRRDFIAGLGSAVAWPMVARAQQRAMPVVGWLSTRDSQTDDYVLPAFRRGLAVWPLAVWRRPRARIGMFRSLCAHTAPNFRRKEF
jgi:hypothetical protein